MLCGRADVNQFLDQLTWGEYEELRAYQRVKGIADTRADVRFAYMFAVLCCKFGVESQPEDFLYHDRSEDLDAEDDVDFHTLAMQLGARRI